MGGVVDPVGHLGGADDDRGAGSMAMPPACSTDVPAAEARSC